MQDVTRLLSGLTLEQKVGQMFMLAFAGPTGADAEVLIREHHVGACYLSNDNLRTPRQAAQLVGRLQGYARETSAIPLLLAADQEGAWAVLTPHSCPGPGNMGLGATSSAAHTRAMFGVLGRELRAVGLSLDLAPVADANTNPQNPIIGMRSFGEVPEQVARHVQAAIAGLHDAGVGATAKHFPGHGDTALDSHRGLALVDRPRASLEAREFLAFRAAVDAGVDVVMSAHVIFPALDPQWPATLSSALLTGLLRQEMGFDGVILTDSFNMGAMRRVYDPRDAVERAVQAGADMILLAEERYGDEQGSYLTDQIEVIRGLGEAVRAGRVEMARVDAGLARILALKRHCDLAAQSRPDPDDADRVVGATAHRDVERRATEASVVLVQNRGGRVPLGLRPDQRLVVLSGTDAEGFGRMAAGRGIGPNVVERPAEIAFREIRRRHGRTDFVAVHDDLKAVSEQVTGASVAIVVTEKYPLAGFDFPDESQHRLVRMLLDLRQVPVIVLACRDPYELVRFPEVDAYICTMGYRPASAVAGVKVLFGELLPQGRLPVSIPELYPAGHGLRLANG